MAAPRSIDVSRWLAALGLSRYKQIFADNDINLSLLRNLSANDLKELGIYSLGHRKLLLNAISELENQRVPARSRDDVQASTPERRQLTVVFVDLVGSTELAARLDPEDMSDLLRTYQNTLAGEINRFEGYVAKLMGDGALAYFGWPRSHENEAERAVRAALMAVSGVARLKMPNGISLAARAGIATGMVVVGEAIGEGGAREETAVGETLNLAARLQALAPSGGVIIADATRRLVGDGFAFAPTEHVAIKGFEREISAWLVLGEASLPGNLEAGLSGEPAPMVGRDKELALLRQRWDDARNGEGQTFILLGEAGIGKSRLVRALHQSIGAERHRDVRWRCSPFHKDTPLWPVRQELVREGNAATVAALIEQFASGIDPAEATPLLSELLGLAVALPPLGQQSSPDAQRSALLLGLVQHFLSSAEREPLLVVLEDAHWADASTLELTRLLSDRLASSTILLVVTSRPEGLPLFSNVSHLTRLTLGRLARTAVAAMVSSVVSDPVTATRLLDTIHSRTDGVPLFVEELSRALAEHDSALLHADGSIDVPSSLHDTLMARLDRVAGQKEVAQVAACIGRDFDFRQLSAIDDRPESELSLCLQQLCDAELLFAQGAPPDASYSFKHALVRDAAYESLLKSRRRAIHARLVAAIEAGALQASAEVTGQHAAAAGLWSNALHHYGFAGKAALDRGANTEGFALIAKAIEAGGHCAGDVDAQAKMIDLRRARGWAYLTIGDAPRLMTELKEAEESAARFGLHRLQCELLVQRAHVETDFGGEMRRAIGNGRDASHMAARLGDQELASVARFVLGLSHLFAGDYRAAVTELMVDADTYQHGLRMVAVGSSGTLAVDGLAILGDALGHLGRWDEALERGRQAHVIAEETGLAWDLHIANYHMARTLLARGEPEAALPLIQWCIDFGKRLGLRMVVEWNSAFLGKAYTLLGRHEEALVVLERSILACRDMRLLWATTFGLIAKAEALLAAGRTGAEVPAEEALRTSRRLGYKAHQANARRVLALCVHQTDAPLAR